MDTTLSKPDLLTLRQSRGWTQQEAADHAGISRSYYSMLEINGRTPSITVAKKLAHIFKLNWQSFFEISEDE